MGLLCYGPVGSSWAHHESITHTMPMAGQRIKKIELKPAREVTTLIVNQRGGSGYQGARGVVLQYMDLRGKLKSK